MLGKGRIRKGKVGLGLGWGKEGQVLGKGWIRKGRDRVRKAKARARRSHVTPTNK